MASYVAGTLIRTVFTTGIAGGTLATADQLALRFYRDGVADDLADEARLVAVHIEMIQNKLGQPV